MPNRRAEIAMTTDEVDAFLREARSLVLVTMGADGLPDPLPLWYVVDDDGTVLIRTWRRSQKVRNLQRDPRCAVLVDEGERYAELRGVQLTGWMELVDDLDFVLDVFVGTLQKNEGLSAEEAATVRAQSESYGRKQIGMRLHVDQVVSWDHRKLGGELPVKVTA